MANFYQTPEPYYYSHEEVVDISNPYSSQRPHTRGSSNVTLTYNPSSGFEVENGRITNIKITVESNNGETYTINRRPNGVYESDDWWIQVSHRRR